MARKAYREEERKRDKLRREMEKRLTQEIVADIKERRQRILDIGDDEWEAAQDESA